MQRDVHELLRENARLRCLVAEQGQWETYLAGYSCALADMASLDHPHKTEIRALLLKKRIALENIGPS